MSEATRTIESTKKNLTDLIILSNRWGIGMSGSGIAPNFDKEKFLVIQSKLYWSAYPKI